MLSNKNELKTRKPDPKTALENLIKEARLKIPFNLSFEGHCEGRCDECPEKLLEFLDITLTEWEERLKKGDAPSLGELHLIGEDCQKVYSILNKKNVIDFKNCKN